MFAGVFSLSAQTKDEEKADKAKARKEIPAYRQKGYAGNASLSHSPVCRGYEWVQFPHSPSHPYLGE